MGKMGALLSFNIVVGEATVAFLAALAWCSGHVVWLALNNKQIPSWVFTWFDDELVKQPKIFNAYKRKGFAWIINIFWAWLWLFVWPGGDVSTYEPIIGDITLIHIGGVIIEIVMFLILISLFWWFTWDKTS